MSNHNPKCELTFDHDHVHVDGTDGGLWQTLALLQDRGDLTGRDPFIWLGPKCHQLPNCHTCRVGREDHERDCQELDCSAWVWRGGEQRGVSWKHCFARTAIRESIFCHDFIEKLI